MLRSTCLRSRAQASAPWLARSKLVKPKLVKQPLGDTEPSPGARKGERDVYHEGRWQPAVLYDMDSLRPGNEIQGIAVIEASSTTFFVPPDRSVRMDEWSLIWLT